MKIRRLSACTAVPLLWLLGLLVMGPLSAAPSGQGLLGNHQLSADLYPQVIEALQRDAPQAYAVASTEPASPEGTGRAAVYQAQNAAHRLSIEFSDRQVTVSPQGRPDGSIGMRLVAYGYGERLKAVPSVRRSVEANRVEFRRGSDRDASLEIIEWYVNGPLGLEQGFTLPARPVQASDTQRKGSSAQALVLDLALSGRLQPVVKQGSQEVAFLDAAGQTALRYGALHVYDAQGQTLPARFALADDALRIHIEDAAAVYPLTVDPFFFIEEKLVSSDPSGEVYEAFGASVAFNDTDPFDMAVAAFNADEGRGAVYVFQRQALGNWVEQARLTASDGLPGDIFGRSLALSGNTLVVGAPYWDCIPGAVEDCGAAYIFERSFDTWTEVAILHAPGVGFGAGCTDCMYTFGFSVAISGLDLGTLGERHVVIGAPDQDSLEVPHPPGRAFVFRPNLLGIWEQQAELSASDFDSNIDTFGDIFGYSVGINRDTVVVGAPWKTTAGGAFAGAAYVYVLNILGTEWSEQAILTAGDAETNDRFGDDVAINRDDTIVVGVPRKDSLTGAAYLFRRGGALGTTWSQEARLTASDGDVDDRFGTSVAISGENALIGAPGWDGPGNTLDFVGAAYLFQRDINDIWSEINTVTASDGATGDRFANAVGISGVNLVIGSLFNGDDGAAYVYEPLRDPTLAAASLPTSRSVQVGNSATAFATIINTDTVTAAGCGIAPLSSVPAGFSYQTTDPATNALIGTANTPVDIAAGGVQTFLFAFTPAAEIAPTDVQLSYDCANTEPAAVTPGLNTLLLSASATPVPDIVALGATPTGDGTLRLPGVGGSGAFAVASVNVGSSDTITATPGFGSASLPVALSICETNPATGACLGAAAASVTTSIAAGATPTFAIFATATADVPFNPASSRIFVSFTDAGGITRGSTSVAVTTAP